MSAIGTGKIFNYHIRKVVQALDPTLHFFSKRVPVGFDWEKGRNTMTAIGTGKICSYHIWKVVQALDPTLHFFSNRVPIGFDRESVV